MEDYRDSSDLLRELAAPIAPERRSRHRHSSAPDTDRAAKLRAKRNGKRKAARKARY